MHIDREEMQSLERQAQARHLYQKLRESLYAEEMDNEAYLESFRKPDGSLRIHADPEESVRASLKPRTGVSESAAMGSINGLLGGLGRAAS